MRFSPECLMTNAFPAFLRSLSAAVLLLPTLTLAQDGYRQPPEPIRSILDATPTPRVAVSPDNTLLLLLGRPSLAPVAEVAAPTPRWRGSGSIRSPASPRVPRPAPVWR